MRRASSSPESFDFRQPVTLSENKQTSINPAKKSTIFIYFKSSFDRRHSRSFIVFHKTLSMFVRPVKLSSSKSNFFSLFLLSFVVIGIWVVRYYD